MACVQAYQVPGRDEDYDKNGNKRYTLTFQVLTDDPLDGAKTVHDYVLLPDYGDPHPEDPTAFAVSKRPRHDDAGHPMNWFVAVEYAGRDDPVSEPAEVSWSTSKYQVATQRDADDVLVANSAGDPYESGMTVDRTRLVVMIRKNVITWDPIDSENYIDTLNEQPFLAARHPPGFDPSLCKLADVSADAVWLEDRSDIHYWRLSVRVEIDSRGWQVKILDAGYNAILPAAVFGFDRGPIILPGGGKPSSPVPLDGAGGVLAFGDPPVFGTYNPFELVDWTPLGLDY